MPLRRRERHGKDLALARKPTSRERKKRLYSWKQVGIVEKGFLVKQKAKSSGECIKYTEV